MTKKEHCVPGARLRVIKEENMGTALCLDSHKSDGKSPLLFVGDELEVMTKPRKLMNINLVRLRRVSDGWEGEVFWTHVRHCTEMT